MTFFFSSIGMTLFATGWTAYHGLLKCDHHEHMEEPSKGAFVVAG